MSSFQDAHATRRPTRRLGVPCLALAALAVGAFACGRGGAGMITLDQLAANPQRYAGRVVAVEGKISGFVAPGLVELQGVGAKDVVLVQGERLRNFALGQAVRASGRVRVLTPDEIQRDPKIELAPRIAAQFQHTPILTDALVRPARG